ncbi:hypothetical protein BC952_1583 [Flavobacterium limicola]|uniref:Glycerophosphoryl diester phosphodiesterase family protein n=1 Tax=Flavobacterium limicola TaxID=180441 RepID=A0A495S1Q7_9FLAO|nr:hypothetical protein [Flavobacterium limicola]RKS93742.1 hypothetical protein BC952_1583 [Flavobacterium limicola]
MNKNTQYRIDEIRKNGYALDFGNVFNHAFENYKKIALYAGLMLFVFMILMSIFAIVALFTFFDPETVLEKLKAENLQPENLTLNSILIFSGVSILLSSLLSPFSAGLIKMAYCAEIDEEFHVSTMFEYYKARYFKELFIATFLITLLSTGLPKLFDYAQIPFVGFIITVLVTLFTLITIPLIIFGNLKAVEAIQASILIVSKQPVVLLGLLVIGIIATLVGLIGCCIGIVFTIPFMYSLYYATYSEIIGFEKEDKLEEMK